LTHKTIFRDKYKLTNFKPVFIGVIALIVLSYLFMVIPPILHKSSRGIQFGNNLPVTDPNSFVLVLEINDASDGNKVISFSTILVPEISKLGSEKCISDVVIRDYVDFQYGKEKNLWEMEEVGPCILCTSDLAPGESAFFDIKYFTYIVPTVELQIPDKSSIFLNEGSVFSIPEICAEDSPQAVKMIIPISRQNFVTYYSFDDSKNEKTSITDFVPTLTTIKSDFYYPFDKYKIQIGASIGSNQIIDIIGKVHTTDWDIKFTRIPYNGETILELEYTRSRSVRYLVTILLLMLFTTIILSVFIKDNASYFGVLLTVLLGLDGFRNILVPSEILGRTAIDEVFLSLYFLLGLSLSMRFLVIPLWNQVYIKHNGLAIRKPKTKRKNPNF
jgi:hypothetical protein